MEAVPHAVDPNRAAQHGNAVMRLLDEIFPLVEGFYVDLHKNPELSHAEHRTASGVAEWLTRTGYEVHKGVGGTGVVGILRNGPGPTVMLRADMDALPLEEKTGLPYASTARAVDADGTEVPVMHACGHDAHTACLVGAADLLSESREEWAGTVMVVAQPGEESLDGAQAMLADGLFDRFGRPDVILGQHLGPQPAGLISHRAGVILGASSSYRVRVHGEGGHASQPNTTVDPVVIAANIVTRLQSVVSREVSPSEMAVLTVGRIQAGTKANIIPDEAYLEINTRALNTNVSAQLEAAIERIVRAEAAASGATREPEIERFQDAGVTFNDPQSTADVAAAHHAYFGDDYVIHLPDPSPATEDFSYFGLPGDPQPIPYVFWFVGATPHDVWEAAPGDTPYEKMGNVPSNHSPFFSPAREPTLRAGLAAITVAALSYLGSDNQRTGAPAGGAYQSGPGAPATDASGAGAPGADPSGPDFPRSDVPVPDLPHTDLPGPDFQGPAPGDRPASPPSDAHAGPQAGSPADPLGPPPSGAPVSGSPDFPGASSGGPERREHRSEANDAYDSAYLASSWSAPDEDRSSTTQEADMDAVMESQDGERRGEKAEESTLSADMAALLEENDFPQGPSGPPQGPPSGPAYGGPPPQGSAHDAPPPGADDERPDSDYRL
ncbi:MULTISPECIES: amidohydrolase [unclassified Nocardiopsis]|uniref:amidohydrolase n=1 Tax=unclassified Nocardiopsis TaxID=2649073 RepID=UPI00135738AF|nr:MULTISPECIES: amidohydrolase [unclassified Nocardiopsis]